MTIRKRQLLWDWTNSTGAGSTPQNLSKVPYDASHPTVSLNNWNAWDPPENHGRIPFRPLLHDKNRLTGNEWAMFANATAPILIYYNEPERANTSAQEAADTWHRMIVPLRKQKGKKLVSPSCSNDVNGQRWIEDFMGRVKDEMPDYLGLHYYGNTAKEAMEFVEMMHNKWPHLPVMITEIACISRNKDDVLKFTAAFANWADETPWIAEYAFFGCMRILADNFVSPAAQLMNADGSFTDLFYKLMYDQPIKVNGQAIKP